MQTNSGYALVAMTTVAIILKKTLTYEGEALITAAIRWPRIDWASLKIIEMQYDVVMPNAIE